MGRYGFEPFRHTRVGTQLYIGRAECQRFGCPYSQWDHDYDSKKCRVNGCACGRYIGLTAD